MRKFISMLASLALALSLVPAAAFASTEGTSSLTNASVIVEQEAYSCTGAAIEPTVTVTLDGETLASGTDYEVSYANNVAPGTGTVTVTGISSAGYSESASANFTITNNAIFTVYDVVLDSAGNQESSKVLATYTYSEFAALCTQNTTMLAGFYNKKLQATNSYVTFDQIAAAAYKSAGLDDAWNNAKDTSTVSVNVNSTADSFTWSSALTKAALESTYGYWYANATLSGSSLYSADAGTATYAAIAMSYASESMTETTTAADLAASIVGSATPTLRTFLGASDTEGVISAATGKYMVSGVNEIYFYHTSTAANLSNAVVAEIEDQDCTGAAIEPTVSVTYEGETLAEGTDYTVSYTSNIAPGTAKVTISAVEGSGFTGSTTAEFTINNNAIFTVYDVVLNDAGAVQTTTELASYTYKEFAALCARNETSLASIFVKKGSYYVQATDAYVTFDQLASAAYSANNLVAPWLTANDATTVSVNVNSTADNFSWSSAITKAALESTYGYYYPNAALSGSSLYSAEAGTATVAAIGMSYNSVAVSGTATVAETAASALSSAEASLRTYLGSSDSEGVLSTPAGNSMVTGVNEIYFYHTGEAKFAGANSLAYATVAEIEAQDCTGAAIEPMLTVTSYDGDVLSLGTDYTVEYSSNVAPGTAYATISAVADSGYTGEQTVEFTINDSVIFTVYDANVTADCSVVGTKTKLATFTYSQFVALSQQNTTTLASTYAKKGTYYAQATNTYVTFDQLAAAAYASADKTNVWSTYSNSKLFVNVNCSTDNFSWSSAISKATLESTYGYYYASAKINASGSLYSEEAGTATVAAIGMSYASAAISTTTDVAAAAASALGSAEPTLRTYIGASDTDGVVSTPGGNMMVTGVNEITFFHVEDEEFTTVATGQTATCDGYTTSTDDQGVTTTVVGAEGCFTLTYTLYSGSYGTKKATITKIASSASSAYELQIPATVTFDDVTYAVTATAAGTAAASSITYGYTGKISGVTFPEGFTTLGAYSFYNNTALASVSFPSTLSSIGASAFRSSSAANSNKLTSVDLSNTQITTIPTYCFYYNQNLAEVKLPSTCTSYDTYCFGYCIALPDSTSLLTNANVTSWGNYCFIGCAFTEVVIPSTVTLGTYVFRANTALVKVTFAEGCTTTGTYTFYGCTSLASDENIILPSTLTTIGNYAFQGCTALTGITFPESVTTLGDYAFNGCTALASVSFNSSLASIGTYAFQKCTALTSVDLPEALLTIGNYAFSTCTSLADVSLPSNLTSIGNYAFQNCPLTSFDLPQTITSIGNNIFGTDTYSSGLVSTVNIAVEFTEIDWDLPNLTSLGTFSQWSALTSFKLNAPNLTSVTGVLFAYDTNLVTVDLYNTGIEQLGPKTASTTGSSVSVFYECYKLANISLPATLKYMSMSCFTWYGYSGGTMYQKVLGTDSSAIPSIDLDLSHTQLEFVPSHAFYYNLAIKSVVLPETCKTIGYCSFAYATNLASAEMLADYIVSIGYNGFGYCYSLTEITIPAVLGSSYYSAYSTISGSGGLGSYAFNYCTALTTVYFKGGYSTLSNYLATAYVFYNCSKLTTMYFEGGLSGLNTSYLPSTVTTIYAGVNVYGSAEEAAAATIAQESELTWYSQTSGAYTANTLSYSALDLGSPIASYYVQVATSGTVCTNSIASILDGSAGLTVVDSADSSTSASVLQSLIAAGLEAGTASVSSEIDTAAGITDVANLAVALDLSATVNAMVISMQSQIATLESSISALESEIAANQAAAEEAVAELEAAIDDLEAAIAELEQTISDNAEAADTALSELSEALQSKIDEANKTIETLQTQVSTLESSVSTLQSTVASQAEAIATLQTQVSTLESSVSTLQTTVTSQAEAISTLQTTVKDQASAIATLQTKVSTLESSVSTLQTTVTSQAAAIEALQTTVKEQAAAIEALQTTVKEQADTIASQAQQIEDLQTQNNVQSNTNTQLQECIEDLQDQISTLKDTIANLENAHKEQTVKVKKSIKAKQGKTKVLKATGVKGGLVLKSKSKYLKVEVAGKKVKITVKKGAEVGATYKVKVYAAATSKYQASKVITIKVTVK